MTDQVALIASIAEGEVGTKEVYANGHWVNDSKYNKWFGPIPGYPRNGYGYPYCAAFMSWLADKAGMKSLYPRTASCEVAVAWFKAKGRFSDYPAIGAQIFFGSGGGSHTGLVVGFDADHVYTVEANTNTSGSAEGDGVYQKTRVRRDSYVYGYGLPEFDDGIVTADPSKQGKVGYTYKTSAAAPKLSAKPTVPPVSKGDDMEPIDVWRYRGDVVKNGKKVKDPKDAYAYLRDLSEKLDKLTAAVEALAKK